jgi:thiol-disulfide isomerase/thioredoxin
MLRAALLCSALALAGAAMQAQAVEVGAAAPRLELPGDGRTVALPAPGSKLTYIDFWASWCGPCRQSFPWMGEMQRKYAADGLSVVAVNLDAEAADAAAFLAKVPAGFTVAYDPAGDSAVQYGVKGMPTSLLVGADGTVIARHSGFAKADTAELEAGIRKALGLAP